MKNYQNLSRREMIKLFGSSAFFFFPILKTFRAEAADEPIRRFIAFITPHGVHPASFWPSGGGQDFNLNGKILSPLNNYKNDIIVYKGLDIKHSGCDGHLEGMAKVLTGSSSKGLITKYVGGKKRCEAASTKSARANGRSVDQYIAEDFRSKKLTPLKSLEFGVQVALGRNDVGSYISYKDPRKENLSEGDPRKMYKRIVEDHMIPLCGAEGRQMASLAAAAEDDEKSLRTVKKTKILDLMHRNNKSLKTKIGLNSKEAEKLDELESLISDSHDRIVGFKGIDGDICHDIGNNGVNINDPKNIEAVAQMQLDLMLLAFEADITRVATILWRSSRCETGFPHLGISQGYHSSITHNGTSQKAKWNKIETYFMTKYAYLVRRLKEMQDSDGNSKLHNSLLLYFSEMGNGETHSPRDVPCVLAGQAGGYLKTGQYIKKSGISHSNMLLTCAHAMGLTGMKSIGEHNNGKIL